MIYTGPDEPNLRVVRELDTENDDPEMHFTVLVVEEVGKRPGPTPVPPRAPKTVGTEPGPHRHNG